jgi:hypothetical protein
LTANVLRPVCVHSFPFGFKPLLKIQQEPLALFPTELGKPSQINGKGGGNRFSIANAYPRPQFF